MCLIIEVPKKLKNLKRSDLKDALKKVAKKDIVVYKTFYEDSRVKGKYISPVMKKVYLENFHYYQTGVKFTFNCFTDTFYVNRGLHAYTNKKAAIANLFFNKVAVKCIVPKGSEYYLSNKYKEIVSDNLIVTDKIIM